MVAVQKVQGGFAVIDHNGDILVAYRNKKHAEQFAKGHAHLIIGEAERHNERLDDIASYLAERAVRPAPAPAAQAELF